MPPHTLKKGWICIAEAKELRKGDYILHNSDILRINKKEIVVYGTHSHSKLKFYAKAVTGGAEKILTFAHSDKVDILNIIRKTGQVLATQPLQIMDSHSFETLDAEAPQDIIDSLQPNDEVIFITHNNWVRILEKK